MKQTVSTYASTSHQNAWNILKGYPLQSHQRIPPPVDHILPFTLPPPYLFSESVQHVHLLLSQVAIFRKLVKSCAMATDF